MTTRDALLTAIIANPADDVVRKAYADWCRENGQEGLADFIEVQIELAKPCPRGHFVSDFEGGRCVKCQPWHNNLRRRERELWNTTPGHTFTGSPAQIDSRFRYKIDGSELENAPTGASDDTPQAVFRRGFVSEIRCTISDWCGGGNRTCTRCDYVAAHPWEDRCPSCNSHRLLQYPKGIGPEVVRRHPVERVVLTDVEPLAVEVAGRTLYAYTFGRTDIGVRHVINDDLHSHFPPPSSYDITSPESVNSALSTALIAWAKSQPHPARIVTSPVSVDFVTG